MIVFCVGPLDYDVRLGLPDGVYMTAVGAMSSKPDVEWKEEGQGCWTGKSKNGNHYEISSYEVRA